MMKAIGIVFLLLLLNVYSAFASGPSRIFICSAEDATGRQSEIKLNVDEKTAYIRATNMSGAKLPWQVLYDAKTSCALKVRPPETCSMSFNHNLDDPNKPYAAMVGSTRWG